MTNRIVPIDRRSVLRCWQVHVADQEGRGQRFRLVSMNDLEPGKTIWLIRVNRGSHTSGEARFEYVFETRQRLEVSRENICHFHYTDPTDAALRHQRAEIDLGYLVANRVESIEGAYHLVDLFVVEVAS
jgi:hypothetical protein